METKESLGSQRKNLILKMFAASKPSPAQSCIFYNKQRTERQHGWDLQCQARVEPAFVVLTEWR